MPQVAVYCEQELTPRAFEVIRAIVDAEFGEGNITFTDKIAAGQRVLVLGKPPAGAWFGVEFVYTYSLAQLMSKPNAASVLAASIKQVLKKPDPVPFDCPHHVENRLEWYLQRFEWDFDAPTAIDIETSGALGSKHTPEEVGVISVAFYQKGKTPIVLVTPDYITGKSLHNISDIQIQVLAEFLPKFSKAIYHNGKFDTRVLNRVLGVRLVNWFDTMLAHHVLNHAAGDHKLKPAARRLLGADDWEIGLEKYTIGGGHYENIPYDILAQYNAFDVYWTYMLWETLAALIESDENNQKAFALEMAAADFLLDVEVYGIPFDAEYAENYGFELGMKQNGVLYDLSVEVGYVLNPNSPKQVKEYYHSIGIKLATTSEAVLKELMDEGAVSGRDKKVTELILQYRKLGKIRGTYAEGWAKKQRNGRVHATYLVHGTSTGRLSSTQPNAQNVPRDKEIRKMVTIT